MKKVKGNPAQWWMKGKLFIRTGEKRSPKNGEFYELNGVAYWYLDASYLGNITNVQILKHYVPWYKKLMKKLKRGWVR